MLSAQQIAHREYLKSATWKDIRQQVLNRDNYTCKCGQPGYDVHHKTYKNWANEKLEDLITLCRTCHDQLHTLQRATRKSKSIGTRAIWNYLNNKQKDILKNQFNLDELSLYSSIYTHCNYEICNAAAKLLGYNHWYSQNGKKISSNYKPNGRDIPDNLPQKDVKKRKANMLNKARYDIDRFIKLIFNRKIHIEIYDIAYFYLISHYMYSESLRLEKTQLDNEDYLN